MKALNLLQSEGIQPTNNQPTHSPTTLSIVTMPRVSVRIDIDHAMLEKVIENGYNLCLTRDAKVDEEVHKGNVVFIMLPAKYLAPRIVFQWEDKYQVFETMFYKEGGKVTANTPFLDIKLGQLATFDSEGNGKVTGNEDRNKPIWVLNDLTKGARVGIRSHEPDTNTYHSFFLSPPIPAGRTIGLTPMNKYTIFWSRHLVTDTIIDDTVTDPFVFEITGDEIALKYSAEWPHWSEAL